MKLSAISSKIKPRTTVRIKGLVDYSHIANKIEGEELERANQYTNFPSKDGYFKMTITTEGDPKDALIFDANNESEVALAAYVGSKIYESKKEDKIGKKFYSATSKGNEIRVYQKDADGILHQVRLNGNELANGVPVELEMNFFETKFGAGVGLNAVVVDGELKVYNGNIGVKGYEVADDVIELPTRKVRPASNDDDAANENPEINSEKGEVQVSEEPIGSTDAPANDVFDKLMQEFKATGK